MKELSSLARDHLAALRTMDAPPADATTRVWDGVQTRAAAGDLGPELPAEPSVATTASISIKSIALGVLVGAGIAAAAVVGAMEDQGDAPAVVAMTPALDGFRHAAREIWIKNELPTVVEHDATPVEIPPPAIVDPAPVIVEPVDEPPVRSRPTTRGEPKPEADGIAQEVALLSEARSALGAGEAKRALGVLARHAKRFPEGVLARERDVSWITALCVLGRVEQARAKADVFLRAHGSSPHAAKVRASCGGSAE